MGKRDGFDGSRLQIEYLSVGSLTPDPKNARKHSSKQIAKLAQIIDKFGFSTPIIHDEAGMILAGHARLAAAKSLGMTEVPGIRLSHLNGAEKKALAIADNAMTDASAFDDKILREVLIDLTGLDFDVGLTGLDVGVIDFLIDGPAGEAAADPADQVEDPTRTAPAVSQLGDLWALGSHKLVCGDALDGAAYEALLGSERAEMIITDPPFNVRVNGHVSGLGKHQHPEFAMASGEMTDEQFRTFLAGYMRLVVSYSCDGSIHLHFIDWRHLRLMLEAGDGIYPEVKNLCVWNKTNSGMGSLWRSKHELVVAFKNGTAPHINNVELGKHGRHRSNVWEYSGANSFSATRDQDLEAHPTVKPIALVADAMRDCSRRGKIVLDPFMGSGTTILAAQRSGRRAAGIEIDPYYVDTAIRRWQRDTGKAATLVGDGRTFDAIERERAVPSAVNGEGVR